MQPREPFEDHLVNHQSTLAGTQECGSTITLGVRWWKKSSTGGGGQPKPPVIMVHGRSSPGLVSFDLAADFAGQERAYSWARYLAQEADRDVFIMDLQGMGKSDRPAVMNNPANINPNQKQYAYPNPPFPDLEYVCQLGDSLSDWSELETVIKWVINDLKLHDKVDLIGYSAGAYAVGPWAAKNKSRVSGLVTG